MDLYKVEFFDTVLLGDDDSADEDAQFQKILTMETDMVPAKGEMVQLPIRNNRGRAGKSIVRRVLEVYNIYKYVDGSRRKCTCVVRVDLI
jgi:hypothetical protein